MIKPYTKDRRRLKILLVLLIIGIVIVIMAFLYQLNKIYNYEKVSIYLQHLDHTNEISYVYYYYNDVLYENIRMESYADNWSVGKEFIGYVNPDNPMEMVALIDMFIIPAIVSIIPLFIFIFYFIWGLFYLFVNKNHQKLKNTGEKITAKVINLHQCTYFGVKYKIIAVYKNKKYYSNLIDGDIFKFGEEIRFHEYIVNVYIDKNKHYVDLESIKPNLIEY